MVDVQDQAGSKACWPRGKVQVMRCLLGSHLRKDTKYFLLNKTFVCGSFQLYLDMITSTPAGGLWSCWPRSTSWRFRRKSFDPCYNLFYLLLTWKN